MKEDKIKIIKNKPEERYLEERLNRIYTFAKKDGKGGKEAISNKEAKIKKLL